MTTTSHGNATRQRVFDIYANSVKNGGGTFDGEGKPVTSGVAVTVEILDAPRLLTRRDIVFAQSRVSPGNALGTWYDEENARWEISETAVMADRESALTLARSLDERYVYDLDADECVAVS